MKFLTFALLASTAAAVVTSPWTRSSSSSNFVSTSFQAGCNFIDSGSQNELTMFQAETFDPATIDRELGYAASLGMKTVRVFLHNLLWDQGPADFLSRLDDFLAISESHDIGVMFVLLDSCWGSSPASGKQPDPVPFVHNSVWVQAPGLAVVSSGVSSVSFQNLEDYVTGVVTRFGTDVRVVAWDLWNEPDNSGYTPDEIKPLLEQVFDWVESVQPTQPLTTPLWKVKDWSAVSSLTVLEKVQIERSDIISFHHYGDGDALSAAISELETFGKAVVCTEYMARENDSFFNPNLGIMAAANVVAYNWGLVNGLTQTIYPWDSWNVPNPYSGPPDIWFHEIFNQDGTPYSQDEADYIRNVTASVANV